MGHRIASRCLNARGTGGKTAPTLQPVPGLTPATMQALGNVLPLLICGEESATLVFDDLAARLQGQLCESHLDALRSITQDENRHADMLEAWRTRLPAAQDRRTAYRTARFLRVLKVPDPARQLARLCAVDEAVATVLAALLRRSSVVAGCTELADTLRQIQQDESRHIRITRHSVQALGLSREHTDWEQARVLHGFIGLLVPMQADLANLSAPLGPLVRRWNLWQTRALAAGSLAQLQSLQVPAETPMPELVAA